MNIKIIQSYTYPTQDILEITVALPDRSVGATKADIYAAFVEELRGLARTAPVLGQTVRLNGPATTEMALALGVWATRYGAAGIELFDPQTGGYVPVVGSGSGIEMPLPVEPGMRVKIVKSGLLSAGAVAEVLNVGTESVNVGSIGGHGRRRETAWTDRSAVEPVAWERLPGF